MRNRPLLNVATGLLLLLLAGCQAADEPAPRAYRNLLDDAPHGRVVGPTPVLRPEDDLLYLPGGTSLTMAVFVRRGTTLRMRRVALRGGSQLEVVVTRESGDERPAASISRSQRDVEVEVEGSSGEPVLLRITATASDGTNAGAALELPRLWAPADEAAPPAPTLGDRANVLVYLIDTLRRDRLGCYGYERPTSPHIDAFAAGAALFENAIAQSSWTKASVASIFTGQWPATHGATGWKHRLPAATQTLAERMREAGWSTAAVVTNPNVIEHYGFDRGFDHFVKRLKVEASEVSDELFQWIDQRPDSDRPFFAYAHTMEPHAPYRPAEPWRERFAPNADEMPTWSPRWRWPKAALPYLSNLYDGDIAANDAEFGRLIEGLRERGLFENTLIVVVSDHGEEFKEHGRWRHGNNLHAETLNVPLIVKLPAQSQGRRIERAVQHIDIAPTILEAVGLPTDGLLEGTSFAALARGETPGEPLPIYSHLRLGKSPLTLSVTHQGWKMIRTRRPDGGGDLALYDIRSDPGETADLTADHPIRLAAMDALLAVRLAASNPAAADEVEIDAEMRENLEALGYLQ